MPSIVIGSRMTFSFINTDHATILSMHNGATWMATTWREEQAMVAGMLSCMEAWCI
jgi:hypothetical protein